MKKDLKDQLKNNKEMKKLSKNHRSLFEQRLNGELHQMPKKNYIFLKIAASLILFLSFGYFAFMLDSSTKNSKKESKTISSREFSPELKKIEDYYLTAINYQISSITITDENRDLLEVYLSQLSLLQKEYKDLNVELTNKKEISESTIDAIIENLQLRLHLLKMLKKKLKKIENLKFKENENSKA